jgi:hypothetical protein
MGTLDAVLLGSVGIDAESMGDFMSLDAYESGATVAEGLEALRDAVDMPDETWAIVPKLERTATAVRSGPRSLSDIAQDIQRTWAKPNFAAVPYIDAMLSLYEVTDHYGCDSATSIVNYFLCNASTWRGADARRIKAELKTLLK